MCLLHGNLLDLEGLCTGWSGKGFWNCLECHTSGLVSMGSIQVLGLSFISKRRQVLLKIARFHIGYNLFAPDLLFTLWIYFSDMTKHFSPKKKILLHKIITWTY